MGFYGIMREFQQKTCGNGMGMEIEFHSVTLVFMQQVASCKVGLRLEELHILSRS